MQRPKRARLQPEYQWFSIVRLLPAEMSYHDRFSVRNFFLAPWRRPRWATLFITLEEKREQKPRNEADIRLTLQLVLVVDEKKCSSDTLLCVNINRWTYERN